LLNGEHDFRAFGFDCTDRDRTVRTLEAKMTMEEGVLFREDHSFPFDMYQFHFKCRSFLHNQVRRMVGAILSYASYDMTTFDKFKSLLDDPNQPWPAGFILAEPYGLFLKRLNYNKSGM